MSETPEPPDNVRPIGDAKKRKRAKAPPKPPSAEEAAFLAGFEGAILAGATIAQIPAFEKAPIDPGLVLPAGYRLSPTGALYRGEGKRAHLVAERVPLIRRVLTDPQTHEVRLEIVWLLRHSWCSAIIERAIVCVGGRDTARALGAVGAPIEPETAKHVAQWLASLERENEHMLPRAMVTSRSGWHELEDGELVFVLGGSALERHELESARVVFDDRGDAAGVTRNVRQGGDEAIARSVVERAIAASDVVAVAICAALAAPLLERVGAPSFAYHLVGPSTRGKTTGLTIAAGLYGCPVIRGGQGWVSSWDSTSVGLEQRAQLSSDLPLCLDEAGLVPAEQRERDVYMLVAGQGRTRGAAKGGLRASTSWRSTVISTGEEELVRVHAAHAGAQVRVIQARVDGIGDLTGQEIAELGADARANFGYLGRQWIAELLTIEDWEPVRLRYRELERMLRQVLGARSSIEQRQAEAFAVLELAAEMAHARLGLPLIDAYPMVSPVRRMAASTEDRVEIVPEWMRALTAIAELLASEPGAFPKLEIGTAGKKTQPQERDAAHRTASRIIGYIDYKPGIDHTPKPETVLYLVPGVARERLEERSLSLDTVARDWKREGVLVPWLGVAERLQRRVSVDGNRQWVFCLDLDQLERCLGGDDGARVRRTEATQAAPAQQRMDLDVPDPDDFQDP